MESQGCESEETKGVSQGKEVNTKHSRLFGVQRGHEKSEQSMDRMKDHLFVAFSLSLAG